VRVDPAIMICGVSVNAALEGQRKKRDLKGHKLFNSASHICKFKRESTR
jgi:hypothetical protein